MSHASIAVRKVNLSRAKSCKQQLHLAEPYLPAKLPNMIATLSTVRGVVLQKDLKTNVVRTDLPQTPELLRISEKSVQNVLERMMPVEKAGANTLKKTRQLDHPEIVSSQVQHETAKKDIEEESIEDESSSKHSVQQVEDAEASKLFNANGHSDRAKQRKQS
jgi:hypothetical protein